MVEVRQYVGTSTLTHAAFHSPTVPCVWRHHNRKWSSGWGGLGLSNAPGGEEGEERISGLHCKSVCWSGTHAPARRCAWTTPNRVTRSSRALLFSSKWSLFTYDGTSNGAAQRTAEPAHPLPPPGEDRGTPRRWANTIQNSIYSFICFRKIQEHTALYRLTFTRVDSGMIVLRLLPSTTKTNSVFGRRKGIIQKDLLF